MACSNCFNGCTEIVSDQCVKYTGVPVAVLGIQTGDSLSYVEQSLIGFLTSCLDGTGIKPTLDPDIICELVNKYLPHCGELSAADLFNALIKAACDLQAQVDQIVLQLLALEGPYDTDCLLGVDANSGTHAILQAVITKLCALDASFSAFVIDVETNYVKKSELCALVAACLPSPGVTQYKDRMVPYTVVEYYGSLSNFDGSGAGLPASGFDKIYLCNGSNGTPDKRGRIPVGAIQAVLGGGPLNPAVDPAIAGNPNYALNTTTGANTITLTPAQMPSHTHTTDPKIVDPGHTHFTVNTSSPPQQTGVPVDALHAVATYHSTDGNLGYSLMNSTVLGANVGLTSKDVTGIDIIDKTITSTGGGQSHNNIPPVLACYYIMYIP